MYKNKFIFLFLFIFFFTLESYSQVDYSDLWEDFYSYNNVKDFYLDNDKIYAVSDNAVFIYDTITQSYKKISSINGLSGETTSSFFYSKNTKKIIIGYENGLIEIINPDGSVKVANDIVRLNITGSKRINHFLQYQNKLYIATDFAILEYDIENLAFGDTFYIGDQSTNVIINQTAIFNNRIYAATKNGIYYADVNNPTLIDFNNWTQLQGNFTGDFKAIHIFNDELFASKSKYLYKINTDDTLEHLKTFPYNIININSSDLFLNITIKNKSYTYNNQLIIVNQIQSTLDNDFTLNNSFSINNKTYLATEKSGILAKEFGQSEFEEIHPEGPLYNDTYTIGVKNNNLWVVYGSQGFSTFNPIRIRKGFSHFNGTDWINTNNKPIIPGDLIDININPENENQVFLSGWYGGILEVVDDEIVDRYDFHNSGLEYRPDDDNHYTSVSASAYDSQGVLWVTNGYVSDRIKKFGGYDSSWEGYDFNNVIINTEKPGLGDLVIDKNDNKWIETRENGIFVLNKNGSKTKSLNTVVGKGNLPDNKIKALAVDKSNRIWIGTLKGLTRFDNVASLFNSNEYNAEQIKIKLEGGTDENQGQILLGDQTVLSIAIDGADNKWFGTFGGAVGTNPSGQKTLYIFNTENSPLPSNTINEIRVDDSTGKVYFATPKGIVAYNNKVAPFGDTLGETYAYPNPCTKENDFITIDGRKGTHLPRGTNIKILDSAGYLVYETNVLEGIELKGGKAVWNKRNLAGRKVASGVYIIMLSLPDKSETSITKVAIIN